VTRMLCWSLRHVFCCCGKGAPSRASEGSWIHRRNSVTWELPRPLLGQRAVEGAEGNSNLNEVRRRERGGGAGRGGGAWGDGGPGGGRTAPRLRGAGASAAGGGAARGAGDGRGGGRAGDLPPPPPPPMAAPGPRLLAGGECAGQTSVARWPLGTRAGRAREDVGQGGARPPPLRHTARLEVFAATLAPPCRPRPPLARPPPPAASLSWGLRARMTPPHPGGAVLRGRAGADSACGGGRVRGVSTWRPWWKPRRSCWGGGRV